MPSSKTQDKTTLYTYCLQTNNLALLNEWDDVRNGEIHPWTISFGSHKKVWWRCSEGHEWTAAIKTRVQGCGCPICANRIVAAGINDLQTTFPQIAEEWHPDKNGMLTPEMVFAGSTRKVWWRCEKGHEWKVGINTRTRGNGCPVCTGKKVLKGENDLATMYPLVAKEWVIEKNGLLTPEMVTAHSNRKVWWRCEKGHEWQTTISSRTSSAYNCPYCTGRKVLSGFNDLQTVCPEVAKEWHPVNNGMLLPTMVTSGSKKRVWWKCSEGHEWVAIIYSRTGKQKCGCPVCAGKYPKRMSVNVFFAQDNLAKAKQANR